MLSAATLAPVTAGAPRPTGALKFH